MLPSYLNRTQYTSCIKIAGIPILPPLVTEERKQELLEYREKAISIENKLKAKRQSIDSGVMTGSYTDILKNGELPVVETIPAQTPSIPEPTASSSSQTDTDSILGDSFLKNALEDQEFRDFFYSTADRIFKDSIGCSEPFTKENNNENLDHQNDKKNITGGVSNLANITDSKDLLDLSVCNNLNLVSSTHNLPSKDYEQVACYKEIISVNEIPPTPPRIVRRNSYTLESPSPVLLEHMAKENENTQDNQVKWQPLLDNQSEHTGFKTFTPATKPRKTWNKNPSPDFPLVRMNSCPPPPTYVEESTENMKPVALRRTNTFTKTRPKSEVLCSNVSLPTSARTSPVHVLSSAQSTSCIPHRASQRSPVLKNQASSEISTTNENTSIQPNRKKSPVLPATSKTPVTNYTLDGSHSQCGSDFVSASEHYLSDSFSQVSTIISESVSPKPKWVNNANHSHHDTTVDADDSVSVCSSMSLSMFPPASRPSTAEDLDILFTQLQLQHERQMSELLEQQYKEKIWLASLKSNERSILSRSNTAMSAPYEDSLQQPTFVQDRKNVCNKELFPQHISKSPTNVKAPSTEDKKVAAVKITAYAKGYLTRRLLKTERVQRCIEMIQESLRNAFSLQTEQRLQRSELEFHERLAHQLTGSLNELQSIVSAPAAERMAIIAVDRERLKKPLSRPVSALSTATRKSLLRRQMSLSHVEDKPQEMRTRTLSLCSTRSDSASKSNGFSKSSNVQNRKSVHGSNHQKNWPQH